MRNMIREILVLIRASLAGFALMAWEPVYAQTASQAMPQEYQEVLAIVDRLASANNLGDNELAFTIVAGDYAEWKAMELGLCKDDQCSYFGSLNPFVQHRGEIKEIIRQAYLYGDISGSAHSNGTIELPRVAFRLYGSRRDYLSCTIAHEIAHARDAHLFEQTAAYSSASINMSEDQKTLLDYSLNREFELIADQKAWEMMTRAGYPLDTCVHGLTFMHKSAGDGRETEPDFTHPGVKERTEKLSAYIEDHKDNLTAEAATKGRWVYEPDLNLLRFIPEPANRPPSGGG